MKRKGLSLTSFLLTVILVITTALPVFAAGDGRRELLNSVELTPKKLSSTSLNKTVQKVIDAVTTEEMDNAERLMACYDYVVLNMKQKHTGTSFTITPGSETERLYNSGRQDEIFAKIGFAKKIGCCVEYTSMFTVLARKLGYKAKAVQGSTLSAKGGYVEHKWVEITIGKKVYIFDPYLERTFMGSKGTNIPHTFFCTTYEAQGKRFKKRGAF